MKRARKGVRIKTSREIMAEHYYIGHSAEVNVRWSYRAWLFWHHHIAPWFHWFVYRVAHCVSYVTLYSLHLPSTPNHVDMFLYRHNIFKPRWGFIDWLTSPSYLDSFLSISLHCNSRIAKIIIKRFQANDNIQHYNNFMYKLTISYHLTLM